MAADTGVIPNKVFIGCAWLPARPKYLKITKELAHTSPIYFILVGQEKDQRAEELLNLIKKNLFSSSKAIFDVSHGNPNVSLEYGLADAGNMEKTLYLNVHGKSSTKGKKDFSIIASLAGQTRRQYTTEVKLEKLLLEFSKEHNFTKRFEKALKRVVRNVKSRHKKKSYRTLAIKTIRLFDQKETLRRVGLVESLKAEGYVSGDIEFLLRGFHKEDLIYISSGRYADVKIA